MQGTRAVQVVLGEGEPGILRLVLEAQGFHVVGHARGDEELRQVLAVTRPTVIVLDAGISALAMHDAQIGSDYAPIVVVWPKDAVSSVAEERVDPATAVLELGNAVRRVAERHAEPIRIPDAIEERASVEREPVVPRRDRWRGRGRSTLVLVAAWTIAFMALAAIGLAVPSVLRGLRPASTLHPVLDRPERALTADREGLAPSPIDRASGGSCADAAHGRTDPQPFHGKPDDPGRGCGAGRGASAEHGDATGRGHGPGRPDDPGKGSGRGEGSAGSGHASSGHRSTKSHDEKSDEKPDDVGGPSEDSDHGSNSGNGGDSDHGGREASGGNGGASHGY